MRPRHALLALALASAAACGRPPPPPPPAPAPAPVDPAAERRAREEAARRAFREGARLGRGGRWMEAELHYRDAIRLDPGEPSYPMGLATVLLQLGRAGDAADALAAGIAAEETLPRPNHRVLVVDYERYIELLTRLGRADEAASARARQARHRALRDAEAR